MGFLWRAILGRRHLGGSRRKLRTLEIAKRVFYGTVNLGHAFSRDFGTRVFGNCNGIGLQSRPADPGGESRRAPQMLFAIRDRVKCPHYNERRKFKISCCCNGLSALKLLMTA
jgi:hypothetical protein